MGYVSARHDQGASGWWYQMYLLLFRAFWVVVLQQANKQDEGALEQVASRHGEAEIIKISR
jgi:hypothetical protein